MGKWLSTPTVMEEKFDLEKNVADSLDLTLLLHFNITMCSGDWEFPDQGYLTTDLWNESFEVEYSLL